MSGPLPTEIVIGGKPWRVEVVDWLWQKRGCMGMCRRHQHRILIDSHQAEAEQVSTLLHEVLHAAWPQRVVESEHEEQIVARLEQRLRGVCCFAEGCRGRR